jgi:hypothetical protein
MSVYRVGGNKSSQNVFPSVRPTLDLDFANSKTLDPRITFTRASGGSYVGADGLIKYAGVNEARFDHDPSTGESLGLLVEEARTNQVTDSIVLSNMPDKDNVTVVDNAIISPDGTQNASKIIETNFLGAVGLSRLNVSTLANTTYTISGYFKKGERKNVGIFFRNVTFWGTGGGPRAVFNLESGSVLSSSGVLNAVSIVNVGNGWYRCSITATRDSNGTITSGITVGPSNDSGAPFYQGIEGYGIYAWGLQFEAGTSPLSFIPTLGSTRTRAADDASITGKNFSEWYRQDEGTIYVRYNIKGSFGVDGFNRVFEISDGTSSNRFTLLSLGTNDDMFESWPINGANQLNFNAVNTTFNRFYNWVAGYKENDFQRYSIDVNGILDINTDTSISTSNFNQLGIGQDLFPIRKLNGHISRLTYFPKRLPNEQLIALTR